MIKLYTDDTQKLWGFHLREKPLRYHRSKATHTFTLKKSTI